ncbi:hypothetical protein B0O80DRAFT_501674 [Mortierella sp. GBAus27b]|nr:hypothetical protein B0O80DRAFT_501674 [Mortierella sp. GBAus27b]
MIKSIEHPVAAAAQPVEAAAMVNYVKSEWNCSYKMFGCAETMEMQQALQHSRDECQFPTSTNAIIDSPNSNSSASSPTSSCSPASVRSSGRGVPRFSHRQGSSAGSMKWPLRSQRQSSHGRQSSVSQQRQPEATTATTATTGSKGDIAIQVRPSPRLSREREQLSRASGIIGQLTEENSSIRQMIRQLSLQNSKLRKDKDRW